MKPANYLTTYPYPLFNHLPLSPPAPSLLPPTLLFLISGPQFCRSRPRSPTVTGQPSRSIAHSRVLHIQVIGYKYAIDCAPLQQLL